MRKLVPVVMLLLGTAAGGAAGYVLVPPAEPDPVTELADAAGKPAAGEAEFVRMTNQFVVPVVDGSRVTSLVVLSISLEIDPGQTDHVFAKEPKLRDGFLQVLFDHANMGGFDGAFTSARNMDTLRRLLLDRARRDFGPALRSVLITDIARQDA